MRKGLPITVLEEEAKKLVKRWKENAKKWKKEQIQNKRG